MDFSTVTSGLPLAEYSIILIGITIIIISLILKKIFNRSDNTTTQHKIQNKYTLADLKSNDDLEFKVNTYQRNLQKEVSRSIQIIQEEKNKGLIKKVQYG